MDMEIKDIVIVQAKFPKQAIEQLKRKTKEKTAEEAIRKAVEHYNECIAIKQRKVKEEKIPNPIYREMIEQGLV
jgi:phenylacetate-coenzyme A ligase PaaK-like adenylate-forming protein